uniref:DUF19 domain-containing protein n=1 Tax=Parastrongyloides trichosuri TaxID=131310 RepID=A0A0N4ZM09_PARTI
MTVIVCRFWRWPCYYADEVTTKNGTIEYHKSYEILKDTRYFLELLIDHNCRTYMNCPHTFIISMKDEEIKCGKLPKSDKPDIYGYNLEDSRFRTTSNCYTFRGRK